MSLQASPRAKLPDLPELSSMLTYLWIALAVIPSPILILISSEAIAIISALKGYSPMGIAAALAIGQTIGFSTLIHLSDWICERSTRFRALKARADLDRYRRYAPRLALWAAFVGIPPMNLSCVAIGAVGAPIFIIQSLILVGRFTRYWIVASLPELFEEYINLELLPDWLL